MISYGISRHPYISFLYYSYVLITYSIVYFLFLYKYTIEIDGKKEEAFLLFKLKSDGWN